MARGAVLTLGVFLAVGCTGTPPAQDPNQSHNEGGTRASPPPSTRDAGASDAREDDDAGVEPPVNKNPTCGMGHCDLFDPDACDRGDGCQLLLPQDGGTAPLAMCVTAGTQGDGDPCTSHLDCAPGLDCTAEGERGVCRGYCCDLNSTAGCPEGQACRVQLVDESDNVVGVNLCDACDDCDATSPTACSAAEGCYLLPAEGDATECLVCQPAGDLDEGDPCQHANDCSPGLGCFAIGGEPAVCTRFCDVAESDTCPHRCTSLGLVEIPMLGVCTDA